MKRLRLRLAGKRLSLLRRRPGRGWTWFFRGTAPLEILLAEGEREVFFFGHRRFLLVVPFNTGFSHVGSYERTVYFVTLIFAALAAVCTIAPSAEHRFLFRHDDKQYLVFSSNRVVIAGLAFLALAMCGSLLLVTTKLFGLTAGVLTASLAAIPFTALWFAVPLRRLRMLGGHRRDQRGSTAR